MAIPFLNHINLSNNEVQNVRLHNTASITVSSGLGHLYFDTDDGLAKYYRANNDWVTIDPITDASLSGTTLTLSRVQANLTVDLASLLPTNIVETITTTDGAYINLTPNSATDGDVTVTADLSAIDGTSDTTTRFLSKDNTWDVPSYTTVTTTDGTFIELTPNSATSGAVTVTADLSATGTASASTFLAGNNTWSTPSYTTVTTTDGTYINLTPNSATSGSVTVTADLSAVDGTSGANERYLTKTNKWATVDSITGTTYDLAVTAGGSNDAAIELTGSDSTTDTVTISGSGATVKVTESGNIITLDLQDDVTIANNLTVQGNLEVEGTTTTIESTITTFTDPVIELNKVADGGTQGNPLTSSGVEIKRSGGNDVQLVWMEDSDDWEFQAYNHRPGLEGGVQKKQYKLPTSYKTTIGDATSIDVDHYLGTRDVIVQLYDTSSYETVYADVTRTSEQTVTIDFTTAPGAGDVTVLIISAQGEQ
jgi:hypothetical protein